MQGKLEEICCPSCGGDDPAFDREHNIFKCRYCGSVFAVESDMLDTAIRASREGERAQRRAEQLAAARAHIAGAREKTKRLRLALTLSLAACAITFPIGMATCSFDMLTDRTDHWPDVAITELLPVPPAATGKVIAIDNSNFKMEIDSVSSLQFAEYQNACVKAGYDDYIKLPGDDRYFEAMNSEAFDLELTYDRDKQLMTIELEKPRKANGSWYDFEDAEWPKTGTASLAPAPDKQHAIEIVDMTSHWYNIHVDGMSRDEMDAYAEKCRKAGFNLRRDSLFGGYEGKNGDDVSLEIMYRGADTVTVSVTVPKRG